jgi:hypothetical protein
MYFVAHHFEEGFLYRFSFFLFPFFLFLSTYLFAKIGEIKAKNESFRIKKILLRMLF